LNDIVVLIEDFKIFQVILTPLSFKLSFQLAQEKSTFKLSQLHFHWRGSEHRINGHCFSAEMHMVHSNLQNPQKIAVIAFIFAVKIYQIQ
jgi:carbonic anhydrase